MRINTKFEATATLSIDNAVGRNKFQRPPSKPHTGRSNSSVDNLPLRGG